MFRRLTVDEWQSTLAMISFTIFFAVFLLTLFRLWRMPEQTREHLEHMPLDHDT